MTKTKKYTGNDQEEINRARAGIFVDDPQCYDCDKPATLYNDYRLSFGWDQAHNMEYNWYSCDDHKHSHSSADEKYRYPVAPRKIEIKGKARW